MRFDTGVAEIASIARSYDGPAIAKYPIPLFAYPEKLDRASQMKCVISLRALHV